MNPYARTYWFAWLILVLSAAFTGIASLKVAFYSGLLAAVVPTLLTKVFERLGERLAPILGAAAGVAWVWLLFFYEKKFGTAEDFQIASWNLGLDLSTKAAAFAGVGLMTALLPRASFLKSAGWGIMLAAGMTALPYGFIAHIDEITAGPVEVVCLVSAQVPAQEGPYRRPDAMVTTLSVEEKALIKKDFLLVEGPAGAEVLDGEGERYWPLWRYRFVYPGSTATKTRHVVLMISPKPRADQLYTSNVELSRQPDAYTLIHVSATSDQPFVNTSQHETTPNVVLHLEEVMRKVEGVAHPEHLELQIKRASPVGKFYSEQPLVTKPAAFPEKPLEPASKTEVKPLPRPVFSDDPTKAK